MLQVCLKMYEMKYKSIKKTKIENILNNGVEIIFIHTSFNSLSVDILTTRVRNKTQETLKDDCRFSLKNSE